MLKAALTAVATFKKSFFHSNFQGPCDRRVEWPAAGEAFRHIQNPSLMVETVASGSRKKASFQKDDETFNFQMIQESVY